MFTFVLKYGPGYRTNRLQLLNHFYFNVQWLNFSRQVQVINRQCKKNNNSLTCLISYFAANTEYYYFIDKWSSPADGNSN